MLAQLRLGIRDGPNLRQAVHKRAEGHLGRHQVAIQGGERPPWVEQPGGGVRPAVQRLPRQLRRRRPATASWAQQARGRRQ